MQRNLRYCLSADYCDKGVHRLIGFDFQLLSPLFEEKNNNFHYFFNIVHKTGIRGYMNSDHY